MDSLAVHWIDRKQDRSDPRATGIRVIGKQIVDRKVKHEP